MTEFVRTHGSLPFELERMLYSHPSWNEPSSPDCTYLEARNPFKGLVLQKTVLLHPLLKLLVPLAQLHIWNPVKTS